MLSHVLEVSSGTCQQFVDTVNVNIFELLTFTR